MNKRLIFFSLYKKELLEIFRDKKTVLIMILIPLIVYPGMILGSLLLTSFLMNQSTVNEYNVGVCLNEDLYDESENLISMLDESKEEFDYHFVITSYDDENEAYSLVDEGKLDAAVSLSYNEEKDYIDYSIYYYSSENDSLTASTMISDVLDKEEENIFHDKIIMLVPDYDSLKECLGIVSMDNSSKEATMGMLIGEFLPFILLSSVMLGCVTPAIDVTAGERERGTLETMMTLPVKNIDLMISKFMAVTTVAVFSALLNLISMSLVFIFGYNSLASSLSDSIGTINIWSYTPSVLLLLGILPIYACLCSIIFLSVCMAAKTFKEANNISSPFLLIIMFASMIGIIPNITLNNYTAIIPVCNVSLLLRDAFTLKFSTSMILLTFASNVMFIVLGIYLMSLLFNSEDVLFGDGLKGLKLFDKRANIKKGQMPGIGDLFLMFAILLIVMVYSSSLALTKLGIWGTGLCQLMILLIPVLYAFYMKADMKKLFFLNLPRAKDLIASILIFLGVFCIENVVLVLLSNVFPSMLDTGEAINSVIFEAGFFRAILIVGIMPAIAEEAAFRGFLFGTLKYKYPRKIWIAILVSAIAFGAYHMNLLQFFGALMMGIAFAYIVNKSGSIACSSLLHCINNSFSVCCLFYPEIFGNIPVLMNETYSFSDNCILVSLGIVLCVLGILLMEKKSFLIKKAE